MEEAEDIPSLLPDAQATVEERSWPNGWTAPSPPCRTASARRSSVSAMESLLVRARRVLRERLRPLIGPYDEGTP